jgi:hypothetical protein
MCCPYITCGAGSHHVATRHRTVGGRCFDIFFTKNIHVRINVFIGQPPFQWIGASPRLQFDYVTVPKLTQKRSHSFFLFADGVPCEVVPNIEIIGNIVTIPNSIFHNCFQLSVFVFGKWNYGCKDLGRINFNHNNAFITVTFVNFIGNAITATTTITVFVAVAVFVALRN